MIIVTSGHVDHGKSALLQALTGKHTAHLPEEKKRGMTIDLGYAYLPLQDKILGFIDVPGHERFLSNMLAGLGGIHYAMLIVAADEGVQPQTEEHLAILRLLHIEKMMLVITKADREDADKIQQLVAQIQQKYSFLAPSPVFITSATTQQGIAELRDYLAQLPNLAEPYRPFRYAIDRVFSVKGAGTVVTGTAFAGKVSQYDELYLSNGQKVRVKNIHAQNQVTTVGVAGQRLALNISADLDRTLIERGDWIFSRPPFEPTERLTVWVESEVLLNESQSVHIYHAAARTTGKLTLLTAKQLPARSFALAELVLDKPLFLVYGDKLILRSGDAKSLIAGAGVVDVYSPRRYKRTEVRLNFLQHVLQVNKVAQRIKCYLQARAESVEKLCWIEQLSEAQLRALVAENQGILYQDWAFNADYRQQQTENILTALAEYHQQHSDQLGLSKARLYRIAALAQPEKLIYHFIDVLLQEQRLQQTRGWLHLPSHKIQFSDEEQALWQRVLDEFERQHGQALWVRDVANRLEQEETAMRNFLYKAGKLGYLMPVVKDRFFLTENIYAYARLIKQYIAEHGEISANQLRDQLNWGRKLTVQLLEYYDRCGFLRRKGNVHLLRDGDVFDW